MSLESNWSLVLKPGVDTMKTGVNVEYDALLLSIGTRLFFTCAVFMCCCNLCFYFQGHLLVQSVLPLCPVDTFVLLLCHIH